MMAMAIWPSFIDERCSGGIVYSWLIPRTRRRFCHYQNLRQGFSVFMTGTLLKNVILLSDFVC
jgi:hypothetical protein